MEKCLAVLQMLDEDKREATTKTTEAIWQLFVYELAPKTGTHVHTCTTDYSGKEDKMCIYRPVSKGCLSPRFISLFFTVFFIYYYVTVL